jgi:hypothetical protein
MPPDVREADPQAREPVVGGSGRVGVDHPG